jgi:ectoine hydroxylase-related dioxygenase (phytanoyl-CoA dioxygenase family)
MVRTLRPDEVAAYERDGFLLVEEVIPVAELEAMDREIDRIEAEAEPHENKGWILRLGLRSERTRAFAEDPRLVALVEDVVGPGLAIFSVKLTAKPAGCPEVCHWHQDDVYYNAFVLSRARMSVWVPLSDSTEANGGLWVLPGSHRRGLAEHGAYGGQCSKSMGPAEMPVEGAVPVPMKAGGVLLFSACLWHHSKGNATDRMRRAFVISYQEATVRGGNRDQWKVLKEA